jgi:hypothetical protein
MRFLRNKSLKYLPLKYKKANQFFLNKQYKSLKINYFLFLKPTLNNLFGYVYNFYNFKKIKKKITRYKLNFTSISLGITKYKGPAKNSNIALETAGFLLAKKLHLKLITRVNLVLFTRLNRKFKEFLKGFVKLGRIKIKRIFFLSKIAHNGPRLKNKKRR